MKPRVLIAGASRGIGLEMAVQYAAEGWQVIAACREPEQARHWLPPAVDLQTMDITQAESIATLAWHLDDAPLDLLIVNAGIYGPDTEHFIAPSDEEFDRVMHTNVLGAMRVIQAFAPNVAAAKGCIVSLTTRMASMSQTTSAFGLLYRASKAALNMVSRAAAAEFGPKGAIVVCLHPGWVRTDMGGHDATLSVTESVEQMRHIIGSLGPGDNGRFLDQGGRSIEW
ncbi:MAG: SDR family NAD(P)-dependent oxidoreductase [Rhodocyclaceae bacterium]